MAATGHCRRRSSSRCNEFKVIKNGGTLFDDTFNGTTPPAGPSFSGETTPSPVYSVSGGVTEGLDSAGRNVLFLDSSHAVYQSFFLSFGESLTLNTDTLPVSQSALGLKSGQAFTVNGLFDLVAPQPGTFYGIRLSDRLLTGPAAQAGTEVVDLVVLAGVTPGTTQVVLRETNFLTGIVTPLQTITINNPGSDDQILLSLANDPNSNGNIQASFELAHAGALDASTLTPFSVTGRIFDDERLDASSDRRHEHRSAIRVTRRGCVQTGHLWHPRRDPVGRVDLFNRQCVACDQGARRRPVRHRHVHGPGHRQPRRFGGTGH